MGQDKKYSDEFKREVLEQVANGVAPDRQSRSTVMSVVVGRLRASVRSLTSLIDLCSRQEDFTVVRSSTAAVES